MQLWVVRGWLLFS